tara:strand:+ start:328 stop:2997 length:2670 start_codon:yes stop_codon:yes gene_type:complete
MIEKPKKERRFLKTLGRVGEILIQEVLIKIGSNLIKKIGGKKTLPSILFLLTSLSLFAQYPATGNKQRLGYQTTGDGLVFRGRASDTTTIKSSGLNNAYFILDTVNNILFNYIKTKGGWQFSNGDTIIINGVTMPFDSITFNTANNGTVGVGEVEYNDTQGSLIQGLKGGLVTNVIGQQLHQRVNNRTGSTLAKGTAVYLSGSQGNRITVAKALATSDPTSANTFGIVAESIADNQSGYVITEGLITNINTSALVEDSAVYLSPTVAGGFTSTKPQAPQHNVYIGVCVKNSAGSGELFVSIKNGLELTELHDVRITSPIEKASLYYSGGLWRDTTATLLVSDTASMLTNYLRTGIAASTYLTQANAASTYLPLTGGTLTGGLNGTTGTFNTRLGVGSYVASPTLFTSGSGDQEIHFTHSDNVAGRKVSLRLTNNNGGFYTFGGLIYALEGQGLNEYTRMSLGINTAEIMHLTRFSRVGIMNNSPSYTLDVNGTFNATGNSLIGGTFGVTGATTFSSTLGVTGISSLNNKTFIGNLSDNTPTSGDNFNIRLESNDVSSIGFHDGGNTIGNIRFSAATGFVIGASDGLFGPHSTTIAGSTTLSAPLTVNSSAVFNEGSTDSDFRVESDGNVNMVFVDASTNRVGIGTNEPSKTLEVNGTFNSTGDITEGGLNVLTSADTASLSSRIDGKVSLTATESIGGTKTFNNLVNITNQMTISGSVSGGNQLLGKNSSNNGVSDITLGTGLSISSNVLNATERYYFDLGIIAGAADNSASTYDFTYGSNIFVVPTSLNGYCIDSVYIRAIGCSTCPPVSPDLDYYVGVYKANAGARVTTSGATLVGSQITMNEYDLNEVNRNDTLLTGEAWWVYLNGTYTSDLAYITAGFIVKKTCN